MENPVEIETYEHSPQPYFRGMLYGCIGGLAIASALIGVADQFDWFKSFGLEMVSNLSLPPAFASVGAGIGGAIEMFVKNRHPGN